MKKSGKSIAKILKSTVAFEGPLFRVTTEQVRERGGYTVRRDVIRHPGSGGGDGMAQWHPRRAGNITGAAVSSRRQKLLVGAASGQSGPGRRRARGGEARAAGRNRLRCQAVGANLKFFR